MPLVPYESIPIFTLPEISCPGFSRGEPSADIVLQIPDNPSYRLIPKRHEKYVYMIWHYNISIQCNALSVIIMKSFFNQPSIYFHPKNTRPQTLVYQRLKTLTTLDGYSSLHSIAFKI